jgi:hypothetical protein
LDYAWQQDRCFPGQERLAEDLNISIDTVQRGLQELRAYGLIEWKQQGLNKPNVYFILKLSDCKGLQGDGSRTSQDCGNQTPQEDSNREPQECGTTNTKSNHTQQNQTKPFEGLPPSTQGEGNEAYSHRAQSAIRNRKVSEPPRQQEPKLAYIGKPLTQDKIDEKQKQRKNVSGMTSLASLLPHSLQQQPHTRALTIPTVSRTTYSRSTKNAPIFIQAVIEQFTKLLDDEPQSVLWDINRTAKLYRQSKMDEDGFRTLLFDVFRQVQGIPTELIEKKRVDGRPNKMPLFFSILEAKLGLKRSSASGPFCN